MFRLSNIFLFTSLEKCFGGGLFSSDSVTWFFWDKLESVHCKWIYTSDLPELVSIYRKETKDENK